MDITKMTDVKELKALAFDTIQRIEIEQNNLRALQQRIVELSDSKTDGRIVNDATAEGPES